MTLANMRLNDVRAVTKLEEKAMIIASACAQCGAIAELRPHGRRLESGRRMDICIHGGLINEPETSRAVLEGLGAPNADLVLIEALSRWRNADPCAPLQARR